MPIYEFTCRSCHCDFEARVSRVGARPDACPKCGATELDKQMSVFSSHTSSGATTQSKEVSPCSMGAACGRFTGQCQN